jgi:hypothetical protein
MATDLERSYTALAAKAAAYSQLWQYYRGKAPLVYLNRRLESIFKNLDARFTENWAAVVVDAACDRINLAGINSKDKATQDKLSALWQSTNLSITADDVHEAALVCGEAYVIAWPNAAGKVRAYYNDPRLCHVFYDDDDPSAVAMAAKWYDTASGGARLTLYYPDRIDYYASAKQTKDISTAKAFQPDAVLPSAVNPYGQVPVFHFCMRRSIRSELENVIPLQNGINKLLMDMIVGAEFQALKQRWIIANADLDRTALENGPDRVWMIPAGDGQGQPTQVGEFSAADLNNFIDAIDNLSRAIGIITRTPKHYFYSGGSEPSGEALKTAETPLVKKVEDYIARFIPPWRELATFLLKLDGLEVDPVSIVPTFGDPSTVQPVTQAQARQANVAAGIPIETVLRREGWTQEELDQMAKDKDEESGRQQASLASAMVEATRRMDQGQLPNGQPVYPQGTPAGAPAGTPQAQPGATGPVG